jgi:hypothetical protein
MEPEGLTKKPWYHAKMSRQEAETFLAGKPFSRKYFFSIFVTFSFVFFFFSFRSDKRAGSFIVRKSSQRDRLALSHRHHNGTIVHAIIQVSYKGYLLQEDNVPEERQVWFATVTKLLDTLLLNYHSGGKDYLPDGSQLVD